MRRTAIGLAAGVAAGAAILAPQALAHPNLEVDTAISCEGIDYTVTGIDRGTSVSVKTFHQVNGFQNFTTYIWKEGVTAPHIRVPLPPQYQGTNDLTITSTIESEGVSDKEGPVELDCAPPTNTTTVPPPPPPKPPPTCADLRAIYPKAGPNFWKRMGCAVPPKPPTPPPPRRKREVCAMPAKLRIVQQQTGTFYTQTYPLRVIIGARANYRRGGSLILTDSGLQNFVAPNGSRTERLVIPVPPMAKGQVRTIDRTMGFVGVQAFREVFTTYARFVVNGKPCGHTYDRAFEG